MNFSQRLGAAALSHIVLVLPLAPPCLAQAVIPNFSGAVFDNSLNIDNPLFPLVPGTTYTYDVVNTDPGTGEVETEVIVLDVLHGVRTVAGIESRIVRDRVWLEGQIREDTFDWYAQDNAGNVWYMGEDVTDFHYDAMGNLIGTSHPGAWETGVDGALPGYLMEASPLLGDHYYQEFLAGEAQDEAEIIGLGEMHTVPFGAFSDVVRTRDTSALDPTALEHKFYAPGVGKILGHKLDVSTGAIVSVTTLRSVSVVPEPGAATMLLFAAVGLLVGFARRQASLR